MKEQQNSGLTTKRNPLMTATANYHILLCECHVAGYQNILNILLLFIANFSASFFAVTKLNISTFIDELSQTVTAAKKCIGNVDNFSKYASCPKCHSIYPLHSCSVASTGGTKQSKLLIP